MSFSTIDIPEVLQNIENNEYILPDIQRSFVWDTERIEKLFDSILRGYPIGSFLFWKISEKTKKEHFFYEFIKHHYQGRYGENKRIEKNREQTTAVLDGQQRLTALYIGLKGSFFMKKPYLPRHKDTSYEKFELYINLYQENKDEEKPTYYQFSFLSENDEKKDNGCWFRVSDILIRNIATEIHIAKKYQEISDLLKQASEKKKQGEFANETFNLLLEKIKNSKIINYYEAKNYNIDEVLDIFVRTNSGGVILSKSELLLSTVTASWKIKDDSNAREEIHGFVSNINKKYRNKFNFDTDFIMKSSLALTDTGDTKFKLSNFKSKRISAIVKNWEGIKEAIDKAVKITSDFGYDEHTLTSNNALVPVVYYLHRRKCNLAEGDLKSIQTWIVHALLSSLLGGSSDTTLAKALSCIGNKPKHFPWIGLKGEFSSGNRKLIFTSKDIDDLLASTSKKKVFSVLSALYPSYNFKQSFDIDHIYPTSQFKKRLLIEIEMSEEKIEECMEAKDTVANLQFLGEIENQEIKKEKMPNDWLKDYAHKHYDGDHNKWKKENYLQDFIDKDLPKDMSGFLSFYEKRKERMKKKLLEILEVKS